MRTLKHLAVAAVLIGLAAPVRAEYYPGSTDLEGDDPLAGDLWGNAGEAEVVADASVVSVPRSANLPPSFDGTSRTNVLSVDAEEPVVRYLQAGQEAPSASTVYADFLVKGCPLVHDAELQQPDSADMILVYARISQGGDATNLCVYAKDGNGTAREFVLTKTVGADEWHRIVIKASSEGYQIYCDGVEEADLCKTADGADTFCALNAGDPMAGVGFTGTGRVDDLVLSSPDPALPVYTLAWGEGFESVSFTTNGVAGAALAAADGEYRFQAPEGLAVVLTGSTGYRTIEVSGTGTSSAISLPGVSGIAKYFPQSATAGQDGTAANPYEIPDIAALNALKGAVLETNCANLCFVQTDDIDFNGEPAFGGIGVYNDAKVGDIEAGDPRGGTPFSGTYDGQGHRISNIAFESKTYAGVFNQVNGGTIRSLAVENATGAQGVSIVGNAGNGATLQNLVAEGTFGSSAVPANHNAAGIAIRLSAGGAGTLVKDCTNNATIYGTYTKLGGICTLTEARVSGGAVTFDGCVNNGDLIMPSGSTAGRDGLAGIVAYSADTTILTNCANTAAEISSTLVTARIGELVGYAYDGYTLTDQGGNSGDAEKAFVFEQAGTINGFKYATVENGVATTIPPPYTPAAGNTYLLVGDVAASETPVATLTTVGSTIAFDTALGYTFAGTVSAEAPLLVTSSTSGTVTTYTATLAAATWVGGPSGDWDAASNWDYGILPTKDTIVTFTNDAQVAIGAADLCKELVLDNANVTLVRANGVAQPILHFYGNVGSAVSVFSGATGTLGVNDIALFTESSDAYLTIGSGLEILGDVTFRGRSHVSNQYSASFAVTGKTTVSANANIKTIDWADTKFLGGVEVAKGVTAKFKNKPNGETLIQSAVTLVATDNADDRPVTALWLMQYGTTVSGGGAISVDADHASDCYVKKSVETVDDPYEGSYDVYEACRYYDPQGRLIEDFGVVEWLSTNGFTQAQIDALGNTPAGTDRLYECWLLNLNFTVPDASATIGITNITVGNRVSMTVRLVRKAPLAGRINGALYIYGANNLAAGFSRSPIPDESVEYFTGDPTFDLATATGDTVTQTAVATLNNSVTYGDSAKFFKATIEVPWVDNGEDFEPEEP